MLYTHQERERECVCESYMQIMESKSNEQLDIEHCRPFVATESSEHEQQHQC